MPLFARRKHAPKPGAPEVARPIFGATAASPQTHSLTQLQRTIGNRAVQRLLLATAHSSGPAGNDAHTSETHSTNEHVPSLTRGTELSELRERVGVVTGSNVQAVPVEPGSTGGKRAYTHKGQVTISSEATTHDLAHELAHAAQQRSTSGEWLNSGDAERQADVVATAALSHQSVQIAAGRVPSAAIQGAGEPYDREAITLPAPPSGATVKDLKDQLKAKLAAGDITGFSVSGVTAGDPEEIFLYNALVLLANSKRWGSELDIITSIGTGKGEITVRFDTAGKVEARLVGKSAPAVPVAFAKAKDATDALVAKYKLAKVKGEKGKTWSIDELNKVLAAWARLSTTEGAALEGYTLIRTDKLELKGEPLQGQTTHTDEVVTGETKATHVREIRFADSAFADDDRSFIGDSADAMPASFEVLIHEVGHALEAKPFDDLNAPAADDAAKANKATNDAHAAQVAANKAINAALNKKYVVKDTAPAQPFVNEVLAAQKVLQAYEASPNATNQTAAKKAIADRDTARAAVPAKNTVVAGFAAAVKAQDAYMASLDTLLAATDVAAASRKKADALKSGSNTLRLQAFIDFVTTEKISPPTPYAAKHWPSEPAEFYDEAFSLWKNDPVFFGKYSSKLKVWFDKGNHLK